MRAAAPPADVTVYCSARQRAAVHCSAFQDVTLAAFCMGRSASSGRDNP